MDFEKNRFHKARLEIGRISMEEDFPVDLAAAEWAARHGIEWTDGGDGCKEYREFMENYRMLQQMTQPGHNYVAEYFGV